VARETLRFPFFPVYPVYPVYLVNPVYILFSHTEPLLTFFRVCAGDALAAKVSVFHP
jgi:hypothetical protein